MDKKWILVLSVLFVSLLAIGSVNAANLVDRDFDGFFSMEVPKGTTFQKDINNTSENNLTNVFAGYTNENMGIIYSDSFVFSENSSRFSYQGMFEAMNPDSTKCYESQDGDLTILEPTVTGDLNIPLVCKSSGNKMIIIFGKDLDTLKKMGHSVKFK